ncbi:MAG: insulinase family protein [Holosporaceae bacterium]|nr:insulinase family protein [Holosporaceae bacterium]
MNKLRIILPLGLGLVLLFGEVRCYKIKVLVSNRGIKFWLVEDEDTPLVQVMVSFKNVGTAHQEKGKTGIPEFFSHAIFCGSGKYSKSKFAQKCSQISSTMSCRAEFDYLRFALCAPKIVLNKAIPLFNTLITQPNFEEDKVKIIQNGIVYSMFNYAANSFETAFFSIIPAIIFKLHPYGNGQFGSPQDFMALTIEDLRKYKESLSITDADVCVCGNITENEARDLVDKVFARVKSGTPTIDSVKDVGPLLTPQVKRYYVEGPQSSMFFALKSEPPRSKSRWIAEILHKILGKGNVFKGRILHELRTQRGLIYSGTVYPVDYVHSSYLLGFLQTDNSNVQRVIELLKDIIRDLRENGITEEELIFAKRNLKGSLLISLRNSESLCNFFFHKKRQGFGPTILEDTIAQIDRVKLPEVNALAKELNEDMCFIVMGGAKE